MVPERRILKFVIAALVCVSIVSFYKSTTVEVPTKSAAYVMVCFLLLTISVLVFFLNKQNPQGFQERHSFIMELPWNYVHEISVDIHQITSLYKNHIKDAIGEVYVEESSDKLFPKKNYQITFYECTKEENKFSEIVKFLNEEVSLLVGLPGLLALHKFSPNNFESTIYSFSTTERTAYALKNTGGGNFSLERHVFTKDDLIRGEMIGFFTIREFNSEVQRLWFDYETQPFMRMHYVL